MEGLTWHATNGSKPDKPSTRPTPRFTSWWSWRCWAAVNFLANRYDKSYDSTANKQFSLSDQTIKIVKGLKHDVHLTYFGDTGTFPARRADLLDRYSALSPKMHVEYIDPVKKPQQAKAAGYRRDAVVMVDNGPRKEGAKSLTEEEVTGALIRSLKSGERNVCFVTGRRRAQHRR